MAEHTFHGSKVTGIKIGKIKRGNILFVTKHITHVGNLRSVKGREIKICNIRWSIKHAEHSCDVAGIEF